MPTRCQLYATLIFTAASGAALSADISLEKFDVFDNRTHHLHIEGPIVTGDLARIRRLTADLPRGRDERLAVSLNSPGGSVQEGLDIARAFQALDMQVVTDVMTLNGEPGICASACSYIFLGGRYRFLQVGSRLGVHQFAYVEDAWERRSETSRRVQQRSADITSLLSDAYVDPGFFTLMGSKGPEEMHWVDVATLERFKVVTWERAYQENDFTLTGGTTTLVMVHMGLYGINRLSAQCEDGDVAFTSEILLSDGLTVPPGRADAEAISDRFAFHVMSDRYATAPVLLSAQRYDEPGITTEFRLPAAQLATLLLAELLDVRLVEPSGLFIGAGFDIRDGRMKDLIESCMDVEAKAPSSLGGLPDTEMTESPVFVAASLGAARRGQPLPAAPNEPTAPEGMAVMLYDEYLAAWSSPNAEAMAYMDSRYGAVIDFYGSELSRTALIAEKLAFAERWPDRRYSARRETFDVRCPDAYTCLVSAIIDWEASSAARGKSSSGVARYGLGFDMETGQILFENGESRKR